MGHPLLEEPLVPLEDPLVPGLAPTATRLLAVGGDTTKLGHLATNLRLRGYQGMDYSATASSIVTSVDRSTFVVAMSLAPSTRTLRSDAMLLPCSDE
jgi:hypothetical protein